MIGGDYDLRLDLRLNLIKLLLFFPDRECRCQAESGQFAEIRPSLRALFKTQTCSVDEIPMHPIFQETLSCTIHSDVAEVVAAIHEEISFPTSFKLFN